MNIEEFKSQFPQYKDVPDEKLARALYEKLYQDKTSYEKFYKAFVGRDISGGKVEQESTGPLSQFKRGGEIYQEEVKSGLSAMEKFYEEPKGKNVIPAISGAARYVFAPLTAVEKGFVQEPVTGGLETIGVPETPAKIIGETAGMLVTGAVPYGKMVKTAIGNIPESAMIKEAGKVGPEIVKDIGTNVKPPLRFPEEPGVKLAGEMASAGKLNKPVIEESIQKQVADAAKSALSPEENKRIGQQIIDLVYKGNWEWKELPEICARHGITPQEFALRLKDTYSTAGRTLQRLSVVAKKVKETLKDNPEAQKFFDEVTKNLPEPTAFDRFMGGLYSLESTRRGFLVTQLATAVRNTISQSARVTLGAIDDSLQGAIRATVGGETNNLKQTLDGLDTIVATWNRLTPSGRKRLEDILTSSNAELANAKLLGSPVHEVALGSKIANVLNTPNRLQEYFFRKLAFEAKLTQLLEKSGQNIKSIDPNKIPKEMLEEATNYALDMTFAAMPKGEFSKKFIQSWAMNPLLTAGLNPFPRFAFGNALPFLYKFSPISFLKAFNPNVVAELATGNPEKFAELASKATLGSVMLATAFGIRSSEFGGDKWYEIKVGDKTIDSRAFAPFNAFLLIAEAAVHPERLKASDWIQAAVGLNRIAGTALVATDLIRGEKLENSMNIVKSFIGEYLGSFTVPLKTFKDIYTEIDEAEGYRRDTRENSILGPAQKNIPVLSQELPEAKTPLREGPIKDENPSFRQFSGLSVKIKNAIETEIDKLNISTRKIIPNTGVPEADRKLSEFMAPELTKIVPQVLNNPSYQKSSEPIKRLIWAEIFSNIRKSAREKLLETDKNLFMQVKWSGFQEDVREILEQRGIHKKQFKK